MGNYYEVQHTHTGDDKMCPDCMIESLREKNREHARINAFLKEMMHNQERRIEALIEQAKG